MDSLIIEKAKRVRIVITVLAFFVFLYAVYKPDFPKGADFMKLYLIRHGESENNQSGKFTGWLDVKLTKKGTEDAKGIRKYLDKIKFDKVYSSDLCRAVATCRTVLGDCEIEKDPLLRELNVGSIAGKDAALFLNDENYLKTRLTGDFTYFGGESRDDMEKRCAQFLKKAAASGKTNIAAFTHAGFLRTAMMYTFGAEFGRYLIKCSNCAILILEYTDDHWRFNGLINPDEMYV